MAVIINILVIFGLLTKMHFKKAYFYSYSHILPGISNFLIFNYKFMLSQKLNCLQLWRQSMLLWRVVTPKQGNTDIHKLASYFYFHETSYKYYFFYPKFIQLENSITCVFMLSTLLKFEKMASKLNSHYSECS